MESAEDVERILAEAAALRRPGVAEGVGGLFGEGGAPLRPFARVEDDFRVLQSGAPPAPLLGTRTAASAAEFAARWAAAAPALAGFDLKAHGLVAAGGGPAAVLMGAHLDAPFEDALGPKQAPFSDIDLFLVGHADDAARAAAVAALHRHLVAAGATVAHRTEGAATWTGGPGFAVVQVALRGHSTLAEVLHGFDLGAPQVAFDGAEVWVTRLGRLAAERGLVPVDLSVRRRGFERRLARYFARGYDLLFPGLPPKVLHKAITYEGCKPYIFVPLGRKLWAAPNLGCSWLGGAAAEAIAPAADDGPDFDRAPSLRALAALAAGGGPARDEVGPAGPAAFAASRVDRLIDLEVMSGGVPFGDIEAVRLWNLRVGLAAHFAERSEGLSLPAAPLLCAVGPAASVGSPLELGFDPPRVETFRAALNACVAPRADGGASRINAWRLLSLVGPCEHWLGAPVLAAALGERVAKSTARDILSDCAAGVAETFWVLPPVFAPAGKGTALTEDPQFATSLEEWWGPELSWA